MSREEKKNSASEEFYATDLCKSEDQIVSVIHTIQAVLDSQLSLAKPTNEEDMKLSCYITQKISINRIELHRKCYGILVTTVPCCLQDNKFSRVLMSIQVFDQNLMEANKY